MTEPVVYFSEARGLRRGIDLTMLRVLVRDLYADLEDRGMLREWLGFQCVDSHTPDVGTGGTDPGRDIAIELGRSDLWPVEPVENAWSEDGIFDFMQFLAQRVSVPSADQASFHNHGGCGWHYTKFNQVAGRKHFLDKANRVLSRYGDGWQMLPTLAIVSRAPEGLTSLVEAKLPAQFDVRARQRVHSAIEKFRNRKASRDDRRDAVRDLGDVLESMRDDAKMYLGKDESDLFNILNNFNIRHNDRKQKTQYDTIWLSGLFYHFLALIHVLAHAKVRAATA